MRRSLLIVLVVPFVALTKTSIQSKDVEDIQSLKAFLAKTDDRGVLDLVPGFDAQTLSITMKKPLTLRGASQSTKETRPTIIADDGCVSAVGVCAEKDCVVGLHHLRFAHKGGNFEAESTNSSTEFGTACCIGVDGGFLNMSACSVSAVNGTCVGLAGSNSTGWLASCEFANSSIGTAACQAAQVGCQNCEFYNHSHAAVVLIGNRTLAELEGNTMHRCGVLGISATERAGVISEGNTIEHCSQAGVSIVGRSWARVTSNQITNNGDQGVIATSKGSVVVQHSVIRGHDHGVTAMDEESRVWTTSCDLASNRKGPLYAGMGGRVEQDGTVHQGEGVEMSAGPNFDPSRDMAVPVSRNINDSDEDTD